MTNRGRARIMPRTLGCPSHDHCMSETAATSIRETLLRECQGVDTAPWHPKDYAVKSAVDRESLYGPLNDLRIANLIQLTEWALGKGQGYTITPLGKEVLNDP